MKPQDTAPLLTPLAPAALVAPPVLIVGAIVGIRLLWLLSGDDKEEKPKATDAERAPPAAKSTATAKKITRGDVAEALGYGEKRLTRKEAVAALEALGFRKTSAYEALSPDGKFAGLIEFTPDGLIEWKG